ncbi:MAG: glycosyltransferase [Akkermansiaceae bacterium]|nr:glycosyltransferase [Akkermansiaceae bacterium]NNM31285.1 glycosyltransferase [Akkermansiaceae bacterium]
MSVILPAFRTPATWLRRALQSLQRQTYPPGRIECVVVDDGSGGAFPADYRHVIREFSGDFALTYLPRPGNEGPSVARNHAVAASGGEWICILDSDDTLEPEAISACAGAGSGATLIFTDKRLYEADLRTPRLVRRKAEMFAEHCERKGTIEDPLVHMNFVCLGQMIRRDAFDAAGGYDPGLRKAVDYDLELRLAELSEAPNFAHVARPLYNYRVRPSGISGGTRYADHPCEVLRRAARRRGWTIDEVRKDPRKLGPYENTWFDFVVGGEVRKMPYIDYADFSWRPDPARGAPHPE